PLSTLIPHLYTAPSTTDIYTLSLHDALPILGEFTPQQRKRRFFVNCFGIGFDAQVSKRANQFYFKKWLHRLHLSSLLYLLSLLYELVRYKPIELTMEVDGEPIHFERVF